MVQEVWIHGASPDLKNFAGQLSDMFWAPSYKCFPNTPKQEEHENNSLVLPISSCNVYTMFCTVHPSLAVCGHMTKSCDQGMQQKRTENHHKTTFTWLEGQQSSHTATNGNLCSHFIINDSKHDDAYHMSVPKKHYHTWLHSTFQTRSSISMMWITLYTWKILNI